MKKFLSGIAMFMLAFSFLVPSAFATTPVKAIVYKVDALNGGLLDVNIAYIDPTIHGIIEDQLFELHYGASGGAYVDILNYTVGEIQGLIESQILSHATAQGYSITTSDIMMEAVATLNPAELLTIKSATQAWSFNNTPSHSIVTTAAAANGWQISSTRNSSVFYSVNVNTTATIAGNADGYVVLEIATTNSTTAADWKEVSRTRNGQALSLALTLQSVQNIGSELMNIVPAGYYVRLRSVNVNGTPTYSFISGQEVTL